MYQRYINQLPLTYAPQLGIKPAKLAGALTRNQTHDQESNPNYPSVQRTRLQLTEPHGES